ncbi:hypothetical protein CAEBREN_06391 [Caenorhabditis brenneri]|uniref:SCP domain-containing protein n=1 Tax=Caenorhabditis brenneri TaxID=135651 RepID=G0NQ84_CAEBE|nr:hypothetical protein CAEBREN_06391 [Caenorhabditis brenneri]
MNLLVILFSLLFSLVDSDATIANKKKNRELAVEYFNDARYEYSIGLQISNMLELQYNIRLEQEAKKFITCEDIKHGSDYRVQLLQKPFFSKYAVNPDAREIQLNKTSYLENEDFKSKVEFLHPLQYGVGCAELHIKCPYPGGTLLRATAVCLFGPKKTDHISEWEHGKPMSQRDQESASGLCVSSEPLFIRTNRH